MADLRDAVLNAKYIDMVSLADFVVRDCGLPDADDDGTPLPQQNEIAAAIFRWAAMSGSAPGQALSDDFASGHVDADETEETTPVTAEAEAVKPRNTGPTQWPNVGDMPKPAAKGE